MIKQICFSDSYVDKIECKLPEGVRPRILTGLPGITKIFKIVDEMIDDDINWALFTNDPLIVDHAMGAYWYHWGVKKGESKNPYDITYIYDFQKQTYIPIKESTTKDLRVTHIFSRLWMGCTFVNTKNYNEK